MRKKANKNLKELEIEINITRILTNTFYLLFTFLIYLYDF